MVYELLNMQLMIIKINIPFKFQGEKFAKNQEIEIEVDKNNIPLNSFWRNRIRDSKFDNCISVVDKKKKEIIK
jgi:hypothetical protein